MKLVWRDLLIYLSVYYFLQILYRFGLGPAGQKNFEQIASYFRTFGKKMPLAFVLGFFCSQVFTRWWDQYQSIPWPFGIAVYVSSTIQGYDEVGRALRRTIMRYVCKFELKKSESDITFYLIIRLVINDGIPSSFTTGKAEISKNF